MASSRAAVLSAAAVAVLALSGCAGGPPASVTGSVRELRDREGVCASATLVVAPPRRARLVGCLRVGAPGTRFDNAEGRLITELQTEDPDDADLSDWQVQLLRDGQQILNRALDAGPSYRRCSIGRGCSERVADVGAVAGLGPGTYSLRYRLMTEEAFVAGAPATELTIVLR